MGPLLLRNVYNLANNFQIFFKNTLPTLFYLERHVRESKNYCWELFFIVMPTRVSRRFLLIGSSFAEKRAWLSQELPNFLQKYVAYTILSRKTCDGEQKLFLWINLHINAHKGIDDDFNWLGPLLLRNVYNLANNFQIFFKNTLPTLFYLERHVMREQKLLLRIILHSHAHKEYRDDFCWLDRLLLKNVVWFSQELPNFLQKYVAYAILSRKTCDGEQILFLGINLHINADKGIETIFADWTVFCWKTCMIKPRTSKFSSKICCLHYFISKDMWWRAKIIFEN